MIDPSIPLILASQSPRRAALLKQMGFSFQIIVKPIDELVEENISPEAHVIQLSRLKAEAVLDSVTEGIIIGADTIVCLDGQILGKPQNSKEAYTMLQLLSGKTHMVYTGFTLLQIGGETYSDVEETAVTFRNLDSWEIKCYIKTGGPMDKAGGYGIQDRSGFFVDHIDGCFYNVVGFPLTKFYLGLRHLLGDEAFLQN